MKINWHEQPFVRIFLVFAFGIIIDAFLPQLLLFYGCCIVVVFCAYFFYSKTNKNYTTRWINGIFLHAILFFLGAASHNLSLTKNNSNFAGNYLLENNLMQLKIIEEPVEKEKTYKVLVEIVAVKNNETWISTKGKSLIYFKKNSETASLHYGDELFVKTVFNRVLEPLDPYEYNYKKYLENHDINFQAYISDNKNWIFYKKDNGNAVLKFALQIRNYFLNVLTQNNIVGNNFAIASALIIGYEDKLSTETYTLFSEAGVLHILSVSGLHVAIVFYVFSSALQFLDKRKYGKIIKATLLLFMLWFYACITGLSPSVMRSATMFSLVVVAQALQQRATIFNSMSASAFILLLINPLNLFDVGFQLSYLAVLGIVVFNPLFDKLYEPGNWIAKQAWSIISVSVAAQLFTLPISLFYFNQFPSYFLLANLIVIPLSTVILYVGLAVAIVGKIYVIATPLAWVLNKIISLLQWSSELIVALPKSSIHHIYFSFTDAILIYIALSFSIVFLYTKRAKHVVFSLITVLFFCVITLFEKQNNLSKSNLAVHALKKQSVYSFHSNSNLLMLYDSSFYENSFSKKWTDNLITQTNSEKITNAVVSNKLGIKTKSIIAQNNLLITSNKSAYILSKATKEFNFISKVDYIIVSNLPIKQIQKKLTNVYCKNIILDGSISVKKAELLNNWLLKRNFKVHYVLKNKTMFL